MTKLERKYKFDEILKQFNVTEVWTLWDTDVFSDEKCHDISLQSDVHKDAARAIESLYSNIDDVSVCACDVSMNPKHLEYLHHYGTCVYKNGNWVEEVLSSIN